MAFHLMRLTKWSVYGCTLFFIRMLFFRPRPAFLFFYRYKAENILVGILKLIIAYDTFVPGYIGVSILDSAAFFVLLASFAVEGSV